VLTGEVPVDMEGRGAFQDASQATLDDTAVMAPLTRLSKTVGDSKNLNHWFRHALTTMWAQPRGPVHLSLMHDALTGEVAADYVPLSGFFAQSERLSPAAAEHALTRHATNAILDGDLDCLFVLGSGFNERDTMHWTVREKSRAMMIHVNTDMDELTANGDLGHVVP